MSRTNSLQIFRLNVASAALRRPRLRIPAACSDLSSLSTPHGSLTEMLIQSGMLPPVSC